MAINQISLRILNLFAFLSTVLGILIAIYYFQGYLGLTACPLCIFQRVGLIGAGLFFLLAAIHNPGSTGIRIYALLGLIPSLFGAGIAIRHIMIQNMPADEVPACGPDLAYMMEAFPFQKMITTVLRGSGECADIQWSLLGLTIPGWVLVTFIFVILFQLLQLWKGDLLKSGKSY